VARVLVAVALAVVIGGMVLQAGAVTEAATAAPWLRYACSPAPADCGTWYRSGVKLSWDWDNLTSAPSGGDCTTRLFTGDTRGTVVSCQVTSTSGTEWTGQTVTIRIDKTAPTVSGAFSRAPDWGGWFNHPVGFSFRGQDATSGIRACTSGLYRGPDGAGVAATGSCSDVAGNAGYRVLSLNYDATPPPAPRVSATPENRKVGLRWSTRDLVSAVVLRWRTGHPVTVVFRGGGQSYTDRRLRNGRRYRYAVIGVDRAGNRAESRVSAVPTSSRLLNPARGARVHRPPTLVWKKVRRASYYNVQLYRGARKMLSAWPRRTALRLRRHWRYAGRLQRLAPGRYRWYVWPGYGRRSAHRYGRLLGGSHFTVVR
jgi:hypothetical protein